MTPYSPEEIELLEQADQEYEQCRKVCDPIKQRGIKAHCFISKSKGIRNGKRKYRKHWREIELVSSDFGKRFTTKPKWDLLARDVMQESDQQACDKLKDILHENSSDYR